MNDDIDFIDIIWEDRPVRIEHRWINATSVQPHIECPLLAVQGIDDEYGTLQQVDGIVRRVAQARVIKLTDCGHSPHRDQPGELLRGVADFIDDGLGASMQSAAASDA